MVFRVVSLWARSQTSSKREILCHELRTSILNYVILEKSPNTHCNKSCKLLVVENRLLRLFPNIALYGRLRLSLHSLMIMNTAAIPRKPAALARQGPGRRFALRWVVVDAVWSEPVSTWFPCSAGMIQGNSSKFDWSPSMRSRNASQYKGVQWRIP